MSKIKKSTKCDIDQMANELLATMNAYKDVTVEAMTSAVIKTANEAVKELRQANPQGSGKYGSWGKYNRGWRAVRDKKTKGKFKYDMIVHNPLHYRLTHLLEKGHAIVKGGRTVGSAKAFEHIEPVAEKCENILYENLMHELERNT